MKILCAWCGAVIRDQGETERLDSHGICQGCAAKVEAEIKPTEAVQGDGEDREEIESYDSKISTYRQPSRVRLAPSLGQ